ncbi:MAG: glycosyltransferase family 39 protein [Chloroflexota bacterium]
MSVIRRAAAFVQRRPRAVEAGGLILLFGLALGLRLVNVQLVPPFTDETEEVLRAWSIAQGERFPLTNVDAYIGALWSYVLAGAFKLFGRGFELPRVVMAVSGALTVVATYFLTRRLFDRTAAAIAAFLLATCGAHILVNSHVAWSNCATPLLTTVAFWLLARGSLLPGALVLGLALQTHPSVAALLPGAAGWVLWTYRSRAGLVRLAVAALCFLLGYSAVLIYNVQTGFDSVVQALRVSGEYSENARLDGSGYLSSLAGFVLLLGQVLSGAVYAAPSPWPYVQDPRVGLLLGLGLTGVVWAGWRGVTAPAWVLGAALVLLPVLNQRWAPILQARYLMPVVPLVLAATAAWMLVLVRSVARRDGWVVPLTACEAALVIGVVHWQALGAYYEGELEAGRSNEAPILMLRIADDQRRSREPFVVHADLHQLPTGGGGTWAKALDYVLQLEGLRRDVQPRDPSVTIRACDVEAVELRYVQREGRGQSRADPDEPRFPTYWLARQSPTRSRQWQPTGQEMLREPYTLPFRPKSVFDPRVPTFDTGCE